MSFVNELLNKRKTLRSCETVTTSITGNKFVERRNDSGEVEKVKLSEKCAGFVVDTGLDLQLAEILSYLYLSSQDPAQDVDLLKLNGITHVLSVGVDLSALSVPTPEITFWKVDLLDEPKANLSGVFDRCFEFIENARLEKEKNKVLVHCNAGYSRAPTVVIGYLMKRFGYSLPRALDMVREKRDVKPNEGFMKQLAELEKKLSSSSSI